MARENNFLIGNGEILTSGVKINSGGDGKKPPYSLSEASNRLSSNLIKAKNFFESLPGDAKPKNQVVAKLTLHPRYISKSDYPIEMLNSLNLRAIGSKTEKITPLKWGVTKHPDSANTESYFIAGEEKNFSHWFNLLHEGNISNAMEKGIVTIENLSTLAGKEKFKGELNENLHHFEVVLHNDDDIDITELFIEYVEKSGGEINTSKIRKIDGLTFLPVSVSNSLIINKISDFSFVRVARGMPSLRPFTPITRNHSISKSNIILPSTNEIDSSIKTVIFDGGIPFPKELEKWVNYIEPSGIGNPTQEYLNHGLAVTGAYLFGSINSSSLLPTPISHLDHVRVLDEKSGLYDFEIIDVLDRIKNHLDENYYDFVNISLGPDLPIDDDEVTLWTASIDKIFSQGNSVATVAIGNNGERDAMSGLNRIQVPADAVNVISVGACTSTGEHWERASYSAFGPGRCPGRTKPDFVTFGGSDDNPFKILEKDVTGFKTADNQGTSFASPLALRTIAALRATLGQDVSHLSLRALMIQHAEQLNFPLKEVGWGRAILDPLQLITSEDNEFTVLYQGELLVSQHLRVPVPINNVNLQGKIDIKATLAISPDVDIEFPGSYTRHGVEVIFRPNRTKYRFTDGKQSQQPVSETFFTNSVMFKSPEYINRDEGNKWEPIIKHVQTFDASKLSSPVFDVYYHYRENAQKARIQKPIPYSLVITVKAYDINDLYNQVIRSYASILTQFKPQNRIQLKS
ncbi:S8 family peptidase [Vitreoscilla massiliensis]|uniref:S8 family peptidase n=1 Tax=Vitreoscilla massiliensis TaxID=1689272 RepID=A0ABY4E1G5_9NEIS|nr:S8 family peptidase [Vitreoscilla massiliensis]UOO89195.1 S8 family peptidase [Vitreoscilla massiliensis]